MPKKDGLQGAPNKTQHPNREQSTASSTDSTTAYCLQPAQLLAEHPAQPSLLAIDLVEPSLLLEKLATREMARLESWPWHSGQAAGASA